MSDTSRDDICDDCKPSPDDTNHVTGHIFVGWGMGWQPCDTCHGSGRKVTAKAGASCNDAPAVRA